MQSERREPDANENPYSRARLNSENTKLRAEITRLTEALRAAEEREKGLREALAFYARENSWKSCGMYMSGRPNPSSAELDAGNKARQALAGAKP